GVLLCAGAFGRVGPVAAGLLLMVLTAAVTVMLARGMRVPCGCFGIGEQLISWRIVVRDLLLIAGGVLLTVVARRWTVAGWPWPAQLAGVTAVTAVVLGSAWWRRREVIARARATAASRADPAVASASTVGVPTDR